MIRILDEKKRRTMEDIETEYPDCKYLLLDFKDELDISGYLYCISDSIEDYEEICNNRREVNNAGENSIILGNYKEGGIKR